jgi:hypothetical protein
MSAPILAVSRVPRRRRRWPIGLLLLALPLAAYFGSSAWQKRTARLDLSALLAEMDRTEPGWRFADQLAALPDVPDSENAALVIMRAKTAMPRGWNATPLNNFWNDSARFPQHRIGAFGTYLLQSTLSACAEGERLAEPLVQLDRGLFRYQWPLNVFMVILVGVQEMRDVANLVMYRARLQIEIGDVAGACESIQRLRNLSRAGQTLPIFIPQLVRLSIQSVALNALTRLLAQHQLSPAQLEHLQRLFEADEPFDGFLVGIRGEVGALDQTLAAYADGRLTDYYQSMRLLGSMRAPGNYTGLRNLDVAVDEFLERLRLDPPEIERLHLLRAGRKALAIARLPHHEQLAQYRVLEKEVAQRRNLTSRLLPANVKIKVAYLRNLSQLRAAIACLAAERYRLDAGRWPDRLEDLAPKYLAAVPLDPFTGKPLMLRRDEKTLVVYSIGENLKDDAGQIDEGAGPGARWLPTDYGFRLYAVDQRRQPPRPIELSEENAKLFLKFLASLRAFGW